LRKQQQELNYPSYYWIFQQLMHPVWMLIVKELYYIGSIGKVLLVLLQKMGLMSKAVQPIEKKGARPKVHPRRLANAQAELARAQFARLDEFNASRRSVAARYRAELQLDGAEHLLESENTRPIYMRYNLLTRQARQLIQEARSQAMLLGNWYSPAMAPSGVDCRAIFYDPDTCPIAEDASAKVVNLPTYPLMKEEDVDRVIELVRDVLQKEDL
ncbi:MAG TPA: hypothetical protein ENN77_01650, partial [Candidatus Wirthbacteria bacterium]|nr:hypothetical protein [Candidatus Wirthbacteria bacterium]